MPSKDIEKRRAAVRKWQLSHPEEARQKSRESYSRCKEKRVEKSREYYLRNREEIRRKQKEYRETHPEIFRAKDKRSREKALAERPALLKAGELLRTAVKAGKIIRPKSCSQCSIACHPHGHHPDYSKPLKVVWLCVSCHRKEHIRLSSQI